MKFSEVIAALEAGRKIKHSSSSRTYQLTVPVEGAKRQLVGVWPGGTWETAGITFNGDESVEGWEVLS